MSVEIGTATGYIDLLRRLRTFMLNNDWEENRWIKTSGTGAIIVVKATPTEAGSGYTIDDILTVVQAGGSLGTVKVTDVDIGGEVLEVELVDAGSGYTSNFGVEVSGGTGADCEIEFTASGEYEFQAKGTGLAGVNTIYVGISSYSSIGADYFNWRFQGYLGFDGAKTFDEQPGAIPLGTLGTRPAKTPIMCLWNDAIPYWFIGNGRRIIVVAKISTVYEMIYLGYLLPYLPPTMMPYPLCIIGTSLGYVDNAHTGERWSNTSPSHSIGCLQPTAIHNATSGFDIIARPNSSFRFWFVEWSGIANRVVYSNSAEGVSTRDSVHPTWPCGDDTDEIFRQMRNNPNDASYVLSPIIPMHRLNAKNVFGELDGVYHISGFNNAVENIITIDLVDYLVVQNIHRTGQFDYCAVRLS